MTTEQPIAELLNEIEARERLYYCNKCQYFGPTSGHKRPPGNQNDCPYVACESSDSRYLDRVSRELRQRLEREQEQGDAVDFLRREGYRRCDIPACNCPFWHGGNAARRLEEIYAELGELTNDKTALQVITELRQQIEKEKQGKCLMADCNKTEEHFCFKHCIEVFVPPELAEQVFARLEEVP